MATTDSPALVCRLDGARLPLEAPVWRSAAGALLDIDFSPAFPLKRFAQRPPGMWRYREALPLPADTEPVTLGEPQTPLLAAEFFGRRVRLKCEHLFATGSYKDRGAAVMISHARGIGIEHVVEDSSGNAGAAVAAYCARAGIACDIYAPASNSPGKLAQIAAYGARLVAVPGTRADTATAALAAAETSWYASHVWSPFFLHGTKTFAFEVVEQLGWRAPEAIVIPTGNGTLLIGAYIGLCELRAAGVIDRLPRLIAIQAEGCAPLAHGGDAPPSGAAATIAEGIAIARPLRAAQCREAVERTGGVVLTVSDAEITAALGLAVSMGLFIEPTSAAALAALAQLDLRPDAEVVVPLTGHGLKAATKIAHLLKIEGMS